MLHDRLKEARAKSGLSQAEVAKRLGVTQPAYFYMENGDKTPSLAAAKQLARLFNVSLDWLVGADGNENSGS